MLAGEDGIGGINFDNFITAHAIGTVALAVILFDGGLQTRISALKAAWKPAALLATVGVLVTAAITGVAASYILELPLLTGMLLGSIVASTDAAAVFAVLRSQGVHLRERLAAILEIESGSNDPMAIFLTVGLVEVLTARMTLGWDLAALFAMQMDLGTLIGLVNLGVCRQFRAYLTQFSVSLPRVHRDVLQYASRCGYAPQSADTLGALIVTS